MLEQTSVQISASRERWQLEREQRYARRNRIRFIDRLLDELEMLNMADETQVPPDLAIRVSSLAAEMHHPLGGKAPEDFTIPASMDTLYELQDRLMLSLEGTEDEGEEDEPRG
jgi:hypothetical protein